MNDKAKNILKEWIISFFSNRPNIKNIEKDI